MRRPYSSVAVEKLLSHYHDLGSEIPVTDYRQGSIHRVIGDFAAFGIDGCRRLMYISQCIVHLILSMRVEETTYKNINLKVRGRIQCGKRHSSS